MLKFLTKFVASIGEFWKLEIVLTVDSSRACKKFGFSKWSKFEF